MSPILHQPVPPARRAKPARRRPSAQALELDIDALLERVSRQEAAGDALEQALVALQSDVARLADAP